MDEDVAELLKDTGGDEDMIRAKVGWGGVGVWVRGWLCRWGAGEDTG